MTRQRRFLPTFVVLAVAFVLTPGCRYRNAETFWKNLATSNCRLGKKCQREAYIETFSSISACRDDDYERNGTPSEFAEECTDYDPSVGKVCLKWLRTERKSCGIPSGTPIECTGICGPGSEIQFYTFRRHDGEPGDRQLQREDPSDDAEAFASSDGSGAEDSDSDETDDWVTPNDLGLSR